jgi:hypothetical protein
MMRISRICGSWMKQFRGYRFQVMAKAISVVELHYLHKFIITFPKLPICKCKHLFLVFAAGCPWKVVCINHIRHPLESV